MVLELNFSPVLAWVQKSVESLAGFLGFIWMEPFLSSQARPWEASKPPGRRNRWCWRPWRMRGSSRRSRSARSRWSPWRGILHKSIRFRYQLAYKCSPEHVVLSVRKPNSVLLVLQFYDLFKMDRSVHGRTDGRTDGRTNRQTDRQTEGGMDGRHCELLLQNCYILCYGKLSLLWITENVKMSGKIHLEFSESNLLCFQRICP